MIASTASSASARANAAAWRWPSSLSGISIWPCRRLSAFQAVSPWRINRISVMLTNLSDWQYGFFWFHLQPERYRTVVGQADLHMGPELAGFDRDMALPRTVDKVI